MKQLAILAALTAFAIALGGCGGSDSTSTQKPIVLSGQDVGSGNLKPGQRRSAVHAAFGPPVRTTSPNPAHLGSGVAHKGPITCDYYRHPSPGLPAAQQFVRLCFQRGALIIINVPAP